MYRAPPAWPGHAEAARRGIHRATTAREVLGRLDAQQVVDELLGDGRRQDPGCCCCFEHTTSPAWCHRGIVSAWLQAEIGLAVPEFGREQDGVGIEHPKLCAEARTILARRGNTAAGGATK